MTMGGVGTDARGLWLDDPGSMTTISHRRVNPMTMTVKDLDIYDIAHALSRQCRYNGHVDGFLSVARHCVWVANRLESLEFDARTALAGLLHDAAEAYLGDMIRPLKHGELGERYMVIEERLERIIADRFNVAFPFGEAVGEADRFVLMEIESPNGRGARRAWTSTPDEDRTLYLSTFYRLGGVDL